MIGIAGYFIYENHTGIRQILFEKFGWFPTDEQLQFMRYQELNGKLKGEQKYYLRFAGEPYAAKLVKGKLLDKQYAAVYNKITDSVTLDFGDRLCFVPQTKSPFKADARFVFTTKSIVDNIDLQHIDTSYSLDRIYAKLVYEGKAEAYRIVPEKFYSSKYLLQADYFEDKYDTYFNVSTRLEAADRDIKEVLLEEFFNTEEGKNFGYSKNNGDYRDYVVERDFTQSGREEFAIVLTDLEEEKAGRNKNVLIVVAYNPRQENYYLLYKKMFYDKIKIGEYFYFTDEDHYRQYQDEYEQHLKVEYCIHLRLPNEPERVLRYNKAFDKMDEIAEDVFKRVF